MGSAPGFTQDPLAKRSLKEGYVTTVDSVTVVVGQTLRKRYRLEREGGL